MPGKPIPPGFSAVIFLPLLIHHYNPAGHLSQPYCHRSTGISASFSTRMFQDGCSPDVPGVFSPGQDQRMQPSDWNPWLSMFDQILWASSLIRGDGWICPNYPRGFSVGCSRMNQQAESRWIAKERPPDFKGGWITERRPERTSRPPEAIRYLRCCFFLNSGM